MEVTGNKYTKEYKNRISLEDSSVPKCVLGQYRNTLFPNRLSPEGPSRTECHYWSTHVQMY